MAWPFLPLKGITAENGCATQRGLGSNDLQPKKKILPVTDIAWSSPGPGLGKDVVSLRRVLSRGGALGLEVLLQKVGLMLPHFRNVVNLKVSAIDLRIQGQA